MPTQPVTGLPDTWPDASAVTSPADSLAALADSLQVAGSANWVLDCTLAVVAVLLLFLLFHRRS